ncbi:arsenate reductase [Afipia sp. Root123D2]|uniref:arsenate reductase (glutaredoxin) n=1 Tax=Afipia sp. Root123D2 TaxID=1736436 RepID=UPI0006FB0E07|nr:arsenate reductase (glutaredoxin) [Afipia sp. Root123D2]KQW22099.1 arsenate reductase [Afipia sp. Root123D2]
MTDVVIYHNPRCGTSRNTLELIRNAGVEPHIIEYLKSPPSRDVLKDTLRRAGLTPRQAIRAKENLYRELKLDDPAVSDDQLLDAMIAHPVLIERPLVVTSKGVRLCRPSELVIDLLPPQRGPFAKEDGERVIDEHGQRVANT